MSPILIAITGAIYAYICGECAWNRQWMLSIVYGGYAFSNVGLYYLAKAGLGGH